jgi:hypothetical protein
MWGVDTSGRAGQQVTLLSHFPLTFLLFQVYSLIN